MLNKANESLRPRQAFSKTFWLLISCLLSSFIFLLLQGGKLAFMVFIIVAILSVYLMLGKWSGILSSKGSRTLSNSSTWGDFEAGTSLQVKINVQIPGFWPLPYVIVKDRLVRRHGGEYLFEATFVPDWKRRGEIIYETPALRRGFYYFGSSECSTEDIFGLFEHKGFLQLDDSLRVLPQTVKIRDWKLFQQIVKGSNQDAAATKASRETTQINGIRDYVYGDRISRIHWKTTARTGAWKSKEFEKESLPKIMIVLDRNKQSYQNEAQFERAVSTAASFLQFGLKKNLSLGLLSVGKDTEFFEAKYGQEHHKWMMNHLIEVEADGQIGILELLQIHMTHLPQGVFLLIISPNHSILNSMNLLKQRNMISCHLWLTSGKDQMEQKNWLLQLKSRGHYGYAIHDLQDLPEVLGGPSE